MSEIQKKIILDEDSYISALDKIVVRDYYPDLPILESKLREDEIYDPSGSYTSHSEIDGEDTSISIPSNLTVNKFLNTYTSDDNASFNENIERENIKTKSKLLAIGWAEKEEEKSKQKLLLSDENVKTMAALTWPYTAKNNLMWNPNTNFETKKTKLRKYNNNIPMTLSSNTRFSTSNDNSKHIKTSKNTLEREYISTPVYEPGVNAPNIITWGSISGFPSVIEEDNVKSSFKVPDLPSREKRLRKLSEIASKKKIRRTPSPFSPRVKGPSTDKQLRASYTPTPLYSPSPLRKD